MFNNIVNKKVYEKVIEQIQESIFRGEFKKGDKLPSERELSEQMGVSRTSIREAIRVMETMGIIESKQGEGNFICSNINKSLIEPLSLLFKLNNGSWHEVIELRQALELEAVKFASERITNREVMELENIIKEMKEEIDGKNRNEVLVILDQKFHNKISSISKNYLIECLFLTSSKLFEAFIKDAREKIINRYSDERILLNQHIDIYNAIVNKDPNLAYKKMEEHMRLIKENYIK
ncbi:FadR/GntR family transcriptional regulator [Romboutsia sp. 1001713B170207_170306_H8]|uniref:FadR/GntR family transcriptional regulator n=1 Tax=Romboutsia sp. 1001713B170207_170306_H8 TaxID=2787112 RepID=UPI000821214F|nr:FadR/GntR family transcriptional regulator [Romboutsia sp. 1001713B170207_170306_H8]SCH12639.1 L-lactate utilization operon repressor [uncultured Clostridium sp.]